jgi:dTDP-glucose 4,6-dehydratase
MTRNLVDAAAVASVKQFVMLSSDMVYGLPPARPLTECDEPRPIGPYGRSKLASERICAQARSRGLRVTILRPRLIIGSGRLGVLRRLFDRIRLGRSVPIIGPGHQRYQMVSVSDVADACILAIQNPCDETLNLGSADPPTVRELLADVILRAGSRSRLLSLPRWMARAALWSLDAVRMAPLMPEQFCIADVDYVLDTTKAERVLGWRPRLTDADMLWSAYQTYVRSN